MKNKIVVITGGATGIGFAIARELVPGNTVISVDRNPSKIAALKKELPSIHSIRADLTSSEDQKNAIATIEKSFGRIDLLVNNAGKGNSSFDFVRMEEAELQGTIESELAINYEAPVMLTKRALPLLKKSEDPVVVINSTGLVYTPLAIMGSYCASKAALHFLTMTIRHQLAPLKIRVVELPTPSVDTELNTAKGVQKLSPEQFAKAFLRKLSKGEEVIKVGQTVFLEKFSRIAPKMAFRMLNREQPPH
jgi:uncharacterized oxidoreductase